MKKTIKTLAILMVMLISLFVVSSVALADEEVPGGWTEAEDKTITTERKELFEKAVSELTGASYEPVSYEASQVVAGTNHKFTAYRTLVVPDAEPELVEMIIYVDVEGNVSVSSINEISSADAGEEDIEGGWVDAEDPTVTAELKEIFDSAFEGMTGATYEPVSFDAYQIVAGKNYQFTAYQTLVVPDAEKTLVKVYIYVDTAGKATLTDIEEISGQEDPAQEDPAQEDPTQEDPTQEDPTQEDPTPELSGGWTEAEDKTITAERKELFEKAVSELTGATYEPVSYEASQVVAGTNHKFTAYRTLVIPDAEPELVEMIIYVDVEGNVSVASVNEISEAGAGEENLEGGWVDAEDPTVTAELKEIFDSAFEGMTGATYEPVSFDASQVVAGKNYQFTAYQTLTVPNAEKTLVKVYIYVDTAGKATLTKIEEISKQEDPKQEDPKEDPKQEDPKQDAPNTGDTSRNILLALLGLVSAVSIVLIAVRRRRSRIEL